MFYFYTSWVKTAVNSTVRMQKLYTIEKPSDHFTSMDLRKRFSSVPFRKGFWRFGNINRPGLCHLGDDIFRLDDVSLNYISIEVRC